MGQTDAASVQRAAHKDGPAEKERDTSRDHETQHVALLWDFLRADDALKLERLFWCHMSTGQASLARGALRALCALDAERHEDFSAHSVNLFREPTDDALQQTSSDRNKHVTHCKKAIQLLQAMLLRRFSSISGPVGASLSSEERYSVPAWKSGGSALQATGDSKRSHLDSENVGSPVGHQSDSDSLFVSSASVPSTAHLLWLAADMLYEIVDTSPPPEVCAHILQSYLGTNAPAHERASGQLLDQAVVFSEAYKQGGQLPDLAVCSDWVSPATFDEQSVTSFTDLLRRPDFIRRQLDDRPPELATADIADFRRVYGSLVEFDVLLHHIFLTPVVGEDFGFKHPQGSGSTLMSGSTQRSTKFAAIKFLSEIRAYRCMLFVFGDLLGTGVRYNSHSVSKFPLLSESALKALEEAISTQPFLSKHLARHLCSWAPAHAMVTRRIVSCFLDCVAASLEREDVLLGLKLLRCIPLPLALDQVDIFHDGILQSKWSVLMETFQQFPQKLDDNSDGLAPDGHFRDIYPATFQLGIDSILRWHPFNIEESATSLISSRLIRLAIRPTRDYCLVEKRQFQRFHEGSSDLGESLLAASSDSSFRLDWTKLALHCLLSGKIFADVIYSQIQRSLSARDEASASFWINSVPELKPLFFLLAWDLQHKEILQQRAIVESMLRFNNFNHTRRHAFLLGTDATRRPSNAIDASLCVASERISFRILVAWWCVDRLEVASDSSRPLITAQSVFDQLHHQSLPYLLRQQLRLLDDTFVSLSQFKELIQHQPAPSQLPECHDAIVLEPSRDIQFLCCYFALGRVVKAFRGVAEFHRDSCSTIPVSNDESSEEAVVFAIAESAKEIEALLSSSDTNNVSTVTAAAELLLLTCLLTTADFEFDCCCFLASRRIIDGLIIGVRAIIRSLSRYESAATTTKRITSIISAIEWKQRILREMSQAVKLFSSDRILFAGDRVWLSECASSGKYVEFLRSSVVNLAQACLRVEKVELAAELIANSDDRTSFERLSTLFASRLAEAKDSRDRLDLILDELADDSDAPSGLLAAFLSAVDLTVSSSNQRDGAHFAARASSLLSALKPDSGAFPICEIVSRHFELLQRDSNPSSNHDSMVAQVLLEVDSQMQSGDAELIEGVDGESASDVLHLALAEAYEQIVGALHVNNLSSNIALAVLSKLNETRARRKSVAGRPTSGSMYPYFEATLHYLTDLHSVVRLQEQTQNELVRYLRSSPAAWLLYLVFERQDFSSAKTLASTCGEHLISVIISELCGSCKSDHFLTLPTLRFICAEDPVMGVIAAIFGLRPIFETRGQEPPRIRAVLGSNLALLEQALLSAPSSLKSLIHWVCQQYANFCDIFLGLRGELKGELLPHYSQSRIIEGPAMDISERSEILDSMAAQDAAERQLLLEKELQILSLLRSTTAKDTATLYTLFVEELIRQRRWNDALALIDRPYNSIAASSDVSNSGRKSLEALVIQRLFSEVSDLSTATSYDHQEMWHKLLPRVDLSASHAHLLLQQLPRFPNVHVCIELVDFCRCHLQTLFVEQRRCSDTSNQELLAELTHTWYELRLFRDMLQVVMQTNAVQSTLPIPSQDDSREEWQSWGQIAKSCRSDPEAEVRKLLARAHRCASDPDSFGDDVLPLYDCARRLALLFLLPTVDPSSTSTICNEIEEAFLLDALLLGKLKAEPDVRGHFALATMTSVGSDIVIPNTHECYWKFVQPGVVVAKSLRSIRLRTHVEAKLVLIEYLIRWQSDKPSNDNDWLSNMHICLTLLSHVSPEQRSTFAELHEDAPMLMESLLMSELLSPFSRVRDSALWNTFGLSDDVLVQYGHKAALLEPALLDTKVASLGDLSTLIRTNNNPLQQLQIHGASYFLAGGGTVEIAGISERAAAVRSQQLDIKNFERKLIHGARIFALDGTQEQNDLLRRFHAFHRCPRVALCRNILKLCEDASIAGRAAVRFADSIAGAALSLASRGGLNREAGNVADLVAGIAELLQFAQERFADRSSNRAPFAGANECVSECKLLRESCGLLQDLLVDSTDSRLFVRDNHGARPGQPLAWLATVLSSASSAEIVSSGIQTEPSEIPKLHLSARYLRRLHDHKIVSQLRDRLLEVDQIPLALRVCERTSASAFPVYAAWGISLLRLGRYSEAKERLQDALFDVHDDEKDRSADEVTQQQTLLLQIVQTLEQPLFVDQALLRDFYNDLSREFRQGSLRSDISGTSDMSLESYLSAFGSSSSSRALAAASRSERQFLPSSLDDMRTMQCLYYLKRYGTPDMLCDFLLRHRLLGDAVRYVFFGVEARFRISEKSTDPRSKASQISTLQSIQRSLFLDKIFAHCVAYGLISQLCTAVLEVDSTMSHASTRFCLSSLCAMLNQRGAYEVLLEFLVLLHDHARAALTSVKLFRERHSAVPSDKVAFLESARDHLLRALEILAQTGAQESDSATQQARGAVSTAPQSIDDIVAAAAAAVVVSPSLEQASQSVSQEPIHGDDSALSETEITKYLQTVALQLQVAQLAQPLLPPDVPVGGGTNFDNFAIQEQQQSQQYADADTLPTVGDLMGRVTLFGGSAQRLAVAVAAIVHLHKFNLAFQIVQDFRLPCSEGEVYRRAARHLTRKRQLSKVNDMLKNVKGTIDDGEWDRVIESGIIAVLCDELGDVRSAEKYIVRLLDASARVRANISCRKLRAAYLLAVKLNSSALVLQIRDSAKVHDVKVFKLCEQFLGEQ